MRVCQPRPVALKAAKTSLSKRSVVYDLVPLPKTLPGFGESWLVFLVDITLYHSHVRLTETDNI